MRMEDLMPVELRGIVPSVGSIWEWEPLDGLSRETVRVTAVKWNGDEAMVESEPVNNPAERRYWNDLSRWIEATVLVEPAPGEG
jgi:hypothetical protein